MATSSLRADTVYSVQFENNQGSGGTAVNFSGVEPDAAKADPNFSQSNVWNHLGAAFTQPGAFSSSLVNSTGTGAAAQLSITHIDGAFQGTSSFPDTYFFSKSNSSLTISDLAPDSAFTLFLYAATAIPRDVVFTVGNSSFDSFSCNPSSLDPTVSTGSVTGVTSSTGSIMGTWNVGSNNHDNEIDWGGFQLDVASLAPAPIPEPGTVWLLGTGLIGLAGLRRRKLNLGR